MYLNLFCAMNLASLLCFLWGSLWCFLKSQLFLPFLISSLNSMVKSESPMEPTLCPCCFGRHLQMERDKLHHFSPLLWRRRPTLCLMISLFYGHSLFFISSIYFVSCCVWPQAAGGCHCNSWCNLTSLGNWSSRLQE